MMRTRPPNEELSPSNRSSRLPIAAAPPLTQRWADRLRHAAIILLAAGFALTALWLFADLAPGRAVAAFLCIVAAALVPWRLNDGLPSREEQFIVNPVQMPVVRAVVAGMPDPAVLLDRAGRVLHLNEAAVQLVPALRVNELAQFALRSPEFVTALREAIATAQPRRATYADHVPVDRWLELIITPVPVPTAFDGVDHCMLMTFHDLTPLRRVEEMRVDFVANASHELRTPLAAVSGFIDTLLGPARDDAKARERFLGIMQTQAKRMARLIDDLLSLSRVELSAHVRPDAEVDIAPLVRQVIEGLEPLAQERQVVVETELPLEVATIAGDREELLRLFENLIENALKYGAAGGRVVVTLGQAAAADGSAEYRFSVRDFGPGIAPEHLPRLTERFYRVDVGDSRAQGGTGLGLSLVKHIVNRHRGRLLIDSTLGKGATFTACLPSGRSQVKS
jgi:two-component system phosphate regulon sensor histidine kinase PhoR